MRPRALTSMPRPAAHARTAAESYPTYAGFHACALRCPPPVTFLAASTNRESPSRISAAFPSERSISYSVLSRANFTVVSAGSPVRSSTRTTWVLVAMAPSHQGRRQVVNCIEPRESEDEQTPAALVVDEDEQRSA